MPLKIAVQMDHIETISIAGDTSFALSLEAQRRGHELYHYTPDRLSLRDGKVFARIEKLEVRDIKLDEADRPDDWVVPRDDAERLCRTEREARTAADGQATNSGAAAAAGPRTGSSGDMCRTDHSKKAIPNSQSKPPEQAAAASSVT